MSHLLPFASLISCNKLSTSSIVTCVMVTEHNGHYHSIFYMHISHAVALSFAHKIISIVSTLPFVLC